jgi:hypothetical protein
MADADRNSRNCTKKYLWFFVAFALLAPLPVIFIPYRASSSCTCLMPVVDASAHMDHPPVLTDYGHVLDHVDGKLNVVSAADRK